MREEVETSQEVMAVAINQEVMAVAINQEVMAVAINQEVMAVAINQEVMAEASQMREEVETKTIGGRCIVLQKVLRTGDAGNLFKSQLRSRD
ncbi:MAG: hypothetical protein EPO63_01270 [Candidatus Nitrosotenuis sp.]|nr:MAG: hypothetical protein EPO63_01270 [Candidatus Nitrosotenuis sp.]